MGERPLARYHGAALDFDDPSFRTNDPRLMGCGAEFVEDVYDRRGRVLERRSLYCIRPWGHGTEPEILGGHRFVPLRDLEAVEDGSYHVLLGPLGRSWPDRAGTIPHAVPVWDYRPFDPESCVLPHPVGWTWPWVHTGYFSLAVLREEWATGRVNSLPLDGPGVR